eukprot:702842-Pleurochrysis_carterae.AAC.6
MDTPTARRHTSAANKSMATCQTPTFCLVSALQDRVSVTVDWMSDNENVAIHSTCCGAGRRPTSLSLDTLLGSFNRFTTSLHAAARWQVAWTMAMEHSALHRDGLNATGVASSARAGDPPSARRTETAETQPPSP